MHRPHRLACALGCALVLMLAAPASDAQKRSRSKAKPAPDTTAAACTDFHAHANEAWLKVNPLPPGAVSLSALQQFERRAREQQMALLDAAMATPQGGTQQWLGDLWASGLDEAAIERSGIAPIAPLLERIDAIRRAKDIPAVIAALHQAGIPVAFRFGADADLDAPDRQIGYFGQGGLGLPDPAFYTRTDAETRQLLGRYNGYLQKILVLAGTPADQAAAEAQRVIDLESRLAQASRPLSETRDPRSNYAPVATPGLDKTWRRLRLGEFLQAQGVSATTVSIANPAYFESLDGLLGSLKPAQWQAYLRWRVADAMAPYLARAWRDAHFAFHGRVLGAQSAPPARRDAVLEAVNHFAGPLLGEEYTRRHLPAETRTRAGEIASSVRTALDAAIDSDTRFAAATKTEAKAKLAALRIEIAPAPSVPASAPPALDRASFGGNVLKASAWRHAAEMRRIGAPVAPAAGDPLPQRPVLAYDVPGNRLLVTAAVLQPPVLDAHAAPAAQYGSFGALVGRELVHAIDDKGRFADAQGRPRDWWTPADALAWDALANRFATQYGNYTVPQAPGVRLDGRRVRDVVLADQAGLELAWKAFGTAQPAADKDARREFFAGWARLWPQQLASDAAASFVASSAYPPGVWRANGPLINLAAFGESFGCKATAAMRTKPEQQVVVWPALAPAPEPAGKKKGK